jgi:hypothetical protein
METTSTKELILLKDELCELFLTNKIQETKFGWTLNNKRIDIIALHSQNIKYIENLHKSDKYKIIFK